MEVEMDYELIELDYQIHMCEYLLAQKLERCVSGECGRNYNYGEDCECTACNVKELNELRSRYREWTGRRWEMKIIVTDATLSGPSNMERLTSWYMRELQFAVDMFMPAGEMV